MSFPGADEYKILITYNVEQQDHDGYCSGTDEDDIFVEQYELKKSYPVPNTLHPQFLGDGIVMPLEEPCLRMYEKKEESGNCGGGCGCCGCETKYTMVRAEIVRERS